MASKVGIVESINDGKFFTKDSLGNTKELKNGDIIYENDVVFSDGSNSSNSEIRVALEGEDIIVLKNGVQQLFDSSLIASTFGDEEVVFTRKGLEALLQQAGDMTNVESDLRWASFDNYVDITEEETAAGEEEEEVIEEGSIGQFALRDGALVDVISDLRKKSWVRTQDYREVENSEEVEAISLSPLGGSPDIITSIPRPIAPNPIDTIIPIAPTPVSPTPETPIITPIANLSIDDITMYEQDGFMVFTVTLDIPASGNITVNFTTSNGTAESGKDYTPITGIITIPSGSSTAQIRVPINDDYYYEKSETFNVTLTNPTGNVNIVKPVGVGTILDNPPSNNKPLDPNKPDSETGTYGEEDSVYAIITGSITVNEGDKANYTVQIIDKNGNPVVVTKDTKVTVVYKNISTSNDDTEYKDSEYIKKDIIIKAGTSKSEIFDVETKDDYLADNGENFNLSIEKVDTNEFENVVIGDKNGKNKDVTTEILDNTTTNPNNPSTNEKEQEQVVLKIVAADKDGNPIKGTDGNYLTQNEVPEGSDVYYVVLAFKPDTTTFNDSTKLPIQEGKVEVETSNKTASGVNSQTKDDGTEDYISKKEIVELGKPISVKTLDDWKSDNNEQFEIKITDKTYQHPSTPVYENVVTDKNPVTTTIKDDTDITPNNPNDNKIETNQEQVILKIVACDSTGNPIIVNGKYTFANEVAEGSNAKYMVLAFHPNTTEFKTTDKLDVQDGKVTIKTADDTAKTTGTKDNAELDYKSETTKEVTLGTVFEVETLDDYLADDNETFKVSINDSSYKHPSTPIYENVKTDTSSVTTTIKDNTITNTETNSEDVKIVLVAVTSPTTTIADITNPDGTLKITDTNETPEGGKLYYIAVAVDKDGKPLATQGGDVTINYGATPTASDKDATAGVDYDNTTTITTKVGEVFEVKTKDDYYAEGDENFTVKITDLVNSPYETSSIDTDNDKVTSTIKDNPAKTEQPDTGTGNDDPTNGNYGVEDTVYAIITGETTVNEGGEVVYTVKLVDKDGNIVIPTKETTVTVKYTNNGTTSTDDTNKVNNETITVKIPANGSEGKFTVKTKDDYYAEEDESYSLKITDVNKTGEFENIKFDSYPNTIPNNPSNNVTTTIKDNPADINKPDDNTGTDNPTDGKYGEEDTVYAIITGETTVNEGGEVVYTVKLVDKNGNTVTPTKETTVTVKYTNTTTKDGDTDKTNNETITVKIPANGSEGKFTVKTKDDYWAEGDESYNVKITDVGNTGEFENIKFDSYPNTIPNNPSNNVTTTIKDNPADINKPDDNTGTDIPTGNYDKDDTVYVKITQTPSTVEGGDLVHTITLVDKNGDPVTVPEGQTVTVNLKYTVNSGDFTEGDLSTIVKTITITGGNSSVNFTNTAIIDDKVEGNEVYNVTINSVEQSGAFENVAIHEDKTTTGTIQDNAVRIVLVATDSTGKIPLDGDGKVDLSKNTNQTPEGGKLYYVAVAVDKDGKPLDIQAGTVDLSYGNTSDTNDKDATAGTDYVNSKITATIGTVFSVDAKDDYYAEGDEKFTVTISNPQTGTGYKSTVSVDTDHNKVTSTIKDNPAQDNNNSQTPTEEGGYGEEDTVYAIITGTQTIKEGNVSTEYTVKLVDKDGNAVTPTKDTQVTIKFEGTGSKQAGLDDIKKFLDSSGNNISIDAQGKIKVTIPANSSEVKFKVETKDDFYADNNEKFKLTITDVANTGEFENVKFDSYPTTIEGATNNVDTTIIDNTTATPNQDSTTETNGMEKVILKIIACDKNGNPLFEADGKTYKTTSNVSEGDKGYYKVFAFAPNTTEFTSDTKLPDALQGGTVTVSTSDIGAKGIIVAQDKYDGTQDYESQTSVTVTVGDTLFKVQTKDDYKAETEADETFKVGIDSGSYKHPNDNVANALYENVTIDNSGVTTTIEDNNSAENKTVENSPTIDNGTPPSYGQEDTVWAVIETIDSKTDASVIEGNTVTYKVKFVDKYGNPVIVSQDTNVTIKFAGKNTNVTLEDLLKIFSGNSSSTEEITGGFDTNNNLTITIPGGKSEVEFTIQTKDDFTAEGNEKFDLSISDINSSEFENLVYDRVKDGVEGSNKVTTEIKDGVIWGTPENAIVDEDNFDVTITGSSISDTQSLGIQKPNNPDNNYTLSFDNTATKIYQGDFTSTTDYGLENLKAGGQEIHYQTIGNKIIGYIGADVGNGAVADSNKVFEIVLNKDSSILTGTTTKDNYTYTQYKNIDHPVKGALATDGSNKSVLDDNITFEFGFKITDQGSTSDVVKFKVTVNDSLPVAGTQEFVVNEDSTTKLVISPENFKDGKISIRVNGETDYTQLDKDETKEIKDPTDSLKTIGVLKNNGDGTVTFTPSSDYSNYADKPWFEYSVSDFDGDEAAGRVNITVKPVADAPTIFVKDVTTTEDNNNTQEGANKIPLGLKTPLLSKDSEAIKTTIPTDYTSNNKDNVNPSDKYNEISTPDQNEDKTGDNPERNGEITLTFTNGLAVTGAKIFIGNEASASSTITSNNQELKIVIVKTSGGTDIDRDYHHADVTTGQANTLYLTKAEYEALKIQHAEDNDTDIKIKISVTSYEVDDSGKPLNASDSTYSDNTNTNLKSESTAEMTVKINPVTDDIELKFATETGGTISQTDRVNDTFTFSTPINEGSGAIDLKSILSNTSGALNGTGGTKGDLDGSEKRTYTISGIPEGTIVKIGDTEAVADKDEKAILTFKDAENKLIDPEFTMKFPEHFGGGVKAIITLSVYDKGVDSTDTAGVIKTQTVYLNLDVEAVATTPDLNTFQVAQAIGYEDDGRGNGNSATPNSIIDQPQNGIPLNIKVSSTDTDGSEKANVKISDIPNGSALYVYDKSTNIYKLVEVDTSGNIKIDGASVSTSGNITVTQSGGKYTVEIKDYQNDKAPKFIPPSNDDTDYKLKVAVQFVDTVTYNVGTSETKTSNTDWSSATKDIDVIVKNVADAPVGTELKTDIKIDEENELNLKDIYSVEPTNANFKSSDDTENLTVKIKLPAGFTIDNGSPYFIDNGEYVVKASDIIAGNIKIVPPKDFSGSSSFDLTYVTTEKAGENDSKTWHPQTVNIFVNPKADDVNTTNSTTIYEDIVTKVDLTATLKDSGTTNGTETIDNVYISQATINSMISQGYILTVNGVNITSKSTETITPEGKSSGVYYVLTHEEADQITVKNSVEHKINGNFTLDVAYKITDTNNGVFDTKIYGHTHSVTVKAVTDQPTISVVSGSTPNTETVGTIGVKDSGEGVGIYNNGSKIVVWEKGTEFTVLVKSESPDKDDSEEIQRIEIHGVPKGVIVDGAVFKGYTGNDWGVWVIENPSDKILNSDGASLDIKFSITDGANFTGRDMTIKTITKDINAEEKSASTNVRMDMEYTYDQGGTGSTPDYELVKETPTIEEEKPFTLKDLYGVSYTTGTVHGSSWAADFTDLPEGTIFRVKEGQTGVNIYTYTDSTGKLHYVISGINQNKEDIESVFEKIEIITPKDINSDQVGILKGDFSITGTISSTNGAYSHQGTEQKFTDYRINPVTDEMTIAINVADTNEDTATALTITLSNPSDATKTTLVGNSLTIKISETWEDDTTGGVGTKGTLTDNSGKYTITDNGDGTFTITPKSGQPAFAVDTPITGLVYTPAANRDGDVKFEVSIKNKEGNSVTLTSKGDTTIKVTPVIDMKPEVTVVTASSKEDTAVTEGSTTLANAVKLNVSTTISADSSEKFTNIVLDEVPNGFTVWYKDGANLVMATNIGKTGGADFDLTPNISTDALTHRNKWLVPVTNGAMPEIYINAPENWAGDFDFKAQFTLKEQNLTTSEKTVVNVTGKIEAVADGVTIAPTLTFGKAFEWIDLKLNANMKDVDGSETMSLELSGLSNGAMFKVGDKVLDVNQAKYENGKWTITGIKYDEINKIEFMNDKTVETVNVKAWTQEIDKAGNPYTTDIKSSDKTGTFKADIKDVGGILELDKGINLDFSKLETTSLKGINSIDLSKAGENKLENLKLSDVLNMTNDKGELIIKGDIQDKVTFANNNGWSKGSTEETIEGKTFDIYSNSGDNSVKVKVQTEISDGITN